MDLKNLKRRFYVVAIATLIVYVFITLYSKLDICVLVESRDIILISSMAIISAFLLKGLRFYILMKRLAPEAGISFFESMLIRLGSELFSFLGVSYLGDEVFRIYILNKYADIKLGKASIIAYIEVFEEVLIASTIIILGSLANPRLLESIYIRIGLAVSIAILILNLLPIVAI